MTPARRIFINVIASHGRSIFVLACGFLTSRWALKVLGNESYGLLNLIGGMAIKISLLNTSLAISIDRFFAYAIGEEATNKCESNSCQCSRCFFLYPNNLAFKQILNSLVRERGFNRNNCRIYMSLPQGLQCPRSISRQSSPSENYMFLPHK